MDLLDDDTEAVSCSCKDWEHRKPAGGCKHIRFVNDNDALLVAARMPNSERESECPMCGIAVYAVVADGPIQEDREVEWYRLPCAHRVVSQL